jgi:hypothetical protein
MGKIHFVNFCRYFRFCHFRVETAYAERLFDESKESFMIGTFLTEWNVSCFSGGNMCPSREVLLADAAAQKLFLLRVETEKICLETVSTQKEFQLTVERANAEMIFPVAESM